MTNQSITKGEKIARALHAVLSGGRSFNRQLAAQARDELRRMQQVIDALAEDASHAADLAAENEALKARVEDLKTSVLAFCAPHAVMVAEREGLPPRHLRAHEYDILEDAGARLVDYTRHPEKDAG